MEITLINKDYSKVIKELIEKKYIFDAIITDPPYGVSRKHQLGFSNMGRSGMDYGEWDYNFDNVTIVLESIDKDDIYFHPHFMFSDGNYVKGQCDINNNGIYAFRFVMPGLDVVEIIVELVPYLINAYNENSERVILITQTMRNIRQHISKIDELANDYFVQALQFNSLKEVEQNLIVEIKTTTALAQRLHNKKGD